MQGIGTSIVLYARGGLWFGFIVAFIFGMSIKDGGWGWLIAYWVSLFLMRTGLRIFVERDDDFKTFGNQWIDLIVFNVLAVILHLIPMAIFFGLLDWGYSADDIERLLGALVMGIIAGVPISTYLFKLTLHNNGLEIRKEADETTQIDISELREQSWWQRDVYLYPLYVAIAYGGVFVSCIAYNIYPAEYAYPIIAVTSIINLLLSYKVRRSISGEKQKRWLPTEDGFFLFFFIPYIVTGAVIFLATELGPIAYLGIAVLHGLTCTRFLKQWAKGPEYNIRTASINGADNELSKWVPEPNAITHQNDPIDADRVYFAEPPKEIGNIVSSFTTIRADCVAFAWRHRFAHFAILCLAILSIEVGLFALVGDEDFFSQQHLIIYGVTVAYGAVLLFALYDYKNTCTYVGDNGFARYSWSSGSKEIYLEDKWLFDETDYVLTEGIDISSFYTMGERFAEELKLSAYDKQGRKLIDFQALNHAFQDHKRMQFYMVQKLRKNWENVCLSRYQKEIEDGKSVFFKLDRKLSFEFNHDGLFYIYQGDRRPFVFGENRLDVSNGWLGLKYIHSTGYEDSIANFRYAKLPNADAFYELFQAFKASQSENQSLSTA